jgi:putative glutamine amidotransferase
MRSPEPADGRPLIGITGWSILAALQQGMPRPVIDRTVESYFDDYGRAVARAGGFPVYLSATGSATVVERLDGVILAGGDDIDPRRYGRTSARGLGPHDPRRDAFEFELASRALAADLPTLGICRGHQLLNVACGGTLIVDLDGRDEFERHWLPYPASARTQAVVFAPGSLAARIFGEELEVNSFHHQAVDEPGHGVAAVGHAPDGVIEAIELPGRDVLGVQWHPELHRDDEPVFDWIVAAAARSRTTRPSDADSFGVAENAQLVGRTS